MSDEPQQKIWTYRLITMNGLIVDFQAPQPIENLWTIFAGDGYFQMRDAKGEPVRRIPFHAIADLQYFDFQGAALAYAPAASGAKN